MRSAGSRVRINGTAFSFQCSMYFRICPGVNPKMPGSGGVAVLCHAKKRENPDGLRAWALKTEKRRGHNVAAVALANSLAPIAWATWTG
jgi:hypothetical protein